MGGGRRGNEERGTRICSHIERVVLVAGLPSGVHAQAYARYVIGIKLNKEIDNKINKQNR